MPISTKLFQRDAETYTYDPASQVTQILHQFTATNALSRPPVR
jgi:hypothetical protein